MEVAKEGLRWTESRTLANMVLLDTPRAEAETCNLFYIKWFFSKDVFNVPAVPCMNRRVVSQVQRPPNRGGSLVKCFSSHWLLAPGMPTSPELTATPMSHKAYCPVEEWHVTSSLASERVQTQISPARGDESENKVWGIKRKLQNAWQMLRDLSSKTLVPTAWLMTFAREVNSSGRGCLGFLKSKHRINAKAIAGTASWSKWGFQNK